MSKASMEQIERIIESRSLMVLFQSLLSHHSMFPRGMEAFIKGIDPTDSSLVHPFEMFESANEIGRLRELNYIMLDKTLEAFKAFYDHHDNLVLFINIHDSIVDAGSEGVDTLLGQLKVYGIDPKSIILDIADYKEVTIEQVLDFIEAARSAGFYISVDDVGKNYFNMDRILLFNPDMIKINQQYIAKLGNDGYRTSIKKQISKLAHELGIIVGVTGIENSDEMLVAVEDGAQFFQGYYFDRPNVIPLETLDEYLSPSYQQDKLKITDVFIKVEESRKLMSKVIMILNEIREESKSWDTNNCEKAFEAIFEAYPFIQNAWFVDEKGIQVTPGRINHHGFKGRNTQIFKVFDVGHDYSKEEFFGILSMGALDVWITKQYISLLNNDISVSTASYVEPIGGTKYFLCTEISYNRFKSTSLKKD